MLHILLLILKIIGILFLSIVGILLTLLLLILFVPVRYRGDLDFSDKLRGKIFVSWLLHFLTIRFDFGNKMEMTIKILWFRLFQKDEEIEEELLKADLPKKETSEIEESENVFQKKMEEPSRSPRPREPEVQILEKDMRKAEKVKLGITERIRLFLEKLVRKIKGLFHWFRNKKETYERFRAFIENEENQYTFCLLLRQSKRLLRHVLPRKLQGYLRFGLEDPYITGTVLTYISPFYGIYGDKIAVEPVFDEKVLEGNVHAKGHSHLAFLLWCILRLLLNRNFRRLYHAMRGRSA